MQTATSALQTVQTSVPGSPEQKQAQATLTKSETGIAGFADKYPKSAAANQLAGRSLVKLGDYDRAAPIAERSVSLAERKGDPKAMTQALLLRGDVRFGRKDYAGALKDAQSALKLDPKNKGALALRAQAAGRTGTESAAAPPRAPDGAGMSPAGATAPGAAPARASGAALSATGEPARPAAVVMTAEGARKADALTREAAQKLAIDPAAAAALAEKAMALDPANGRAYVVRAAARREARDLMGAMADLDAALSRDPGLAEAHAAKAAALIALGRPRADIEREFLASGRAAADFSDYYRERVAALGAGPRADATGGGSAPDRSWTTAGGLAARARENSGKLMLVGLGLALFGGALLVQTRKRAGDGRED